MKSNLIHLSKIFKPYSNFLLIKLSLQLLGNVELIGKVPQTSCSVSLTLRGIKWRPGEVGHLLGSKSLCSSRTSGSTRLPLQAAHCLLSKLPLHPCHASLFSQVPGKKDKCLKRLWGNLNPVHLLAQHPQEAWKLRSGTLASLGSSRSLAYWQWAKKSTWA